MNNSLEIIKSNLYSFEKRETIRITSSQYKDFIGFWNNGRWNSAKRVGVLMDNIKQLPDDATRKDWVEHYFNVCRKPDQILEQVDQIFKGTQLKYDKTILLNYWWIHIIDSAYRGWRSEVRIKIIVEKFLQKNHPEYTVRWATAEEDKDQGVDLVVLDVNGKVLFGIQIKVKSYFLSNRPTVVEARNVFNPRKYLKFSDINDGALVWYIVIEDTTEDNIKWVKPECYKTQTKEK